MTSTAEAAPALPRATPEAVPRGGGPQRSPASGLVPYIDSARIQTAFCPGDGDRPSTLRAYLRVQPGRWWQWLLIWLLQNVRFCPVYIIPLLTGRLIDRIDRADPGRVLHDVPVVLGIAAALCLFTVAANTGAHALISRIRRSLTAGLRAALIRRINRLELRYHDRSQASELQNKFTIDVGRLEGYQEYFAESLLMYGSVVVVMLAVIACTTPIALIAIVVGVALHLGLVRIFWNRIRDYNEEYRVAETGFMASLIEALHGIRLNRAHTTEAFIDERVSGAAGNVARKAIRLDLMNNLFGSGGWAVSTFLSTAVMGMGVWLAVMPVQHLDLLGSHLVIRPIRIGELTVLMSYYGIIAGALSSILGGMPAVAAATDGIRSLSQLYADDGYEESNHGKPRIPPPAGDIVLERVRFTYDDTDRECLAGVDLRIPPGTTCALVGPSGSGKSTIANLILGFYRPGSGRVLIDGRDLAAIDRRSLRQHIGVVNQEVVLFQDSVLNNIAWGDPVPDRRRAEEAAERANASEFIGRLPGGMGHVLGDRGAGLSGGQRQRLAIARALYRNPRILILDEATSALDQQSEQLVQRALDNAASGRTTLIIAHRLSTVRRCDAICVLDHGRIVERGTFDELMGRDSAFRAMATSQLV